MAKIKLYWRSTMLDEKGPHAYKKFLSCARLFLRSWIPIFCARSMLDKLAWRPLSRWPQWCTGVCYCKVWVWPIQDCAIIQHEYDQCRIVPSYSVSVTNTGLFHHTAWEWPMQDAVWASPIQDTGLCYHTAWVWPLKDYVIVQCEVWPIQDSAILLLTHCIGQDSQADSHSMTAESCIGHTYTARYQTSVFVRLPLDTWWPLDGLC